MALVKGEQRLATEVYQPAADQGDDAHPQRGAKPVPDRQIVFRWRSLQHAGDRHGEERLHGQRRQNAHHQAKDDQHLHRNLHPARGLVRGPAQADRLAIEKHVVNETQRVSHGEHARQGHRRRQQPAEAHLGGGADRLGEKHLLGQEAVQ